MFDFIEVGLYNFVVFLNLLGLIKHLLILIGWFFSGFFHFIVMGILLIEIHLVSKIRLLNLNRVCIGSS
jgi:hypothetical protein